MSVTVMTAQGAEISHPGASNFDVSEAGALRIISVVGKRHLPGVFALGPLVDVTEGTHVYAPGFWAEVWKEAK